MVALATGETPWERYRRRVVEEVFQLQAALDKKNQELDDELAEAQKTCQHVDNGGPIMGHCIKCLVSFG